MEMDVGEKAFILLFLFVTVHGNPSLVHNCLVATPSANSVRGANHLAGREGMPLYELSLQPERTNGSGLSPVFEVLLSSLEKQRDFHDAYISIEVISEEDCGPGTFEFAPEDFSRQIQTGNNCPSLVYTRRKSAMTELPPLVWRPPTCGCVQIRALVMDESFTYGEGSEVITGPLSQQACVHTNKNEERYLDTLCDVINHHVTANILSRASFLRRRNLQISRMDRFCLEMALELRRSDTRQCCSMTNTDGRLQCFDNIQRRRIDRFCADGYPNIPFTKTRITHMKDMEQKCCKILGPRRYPCFVDGDSEVNGAGFSPLDFSLDETHPVNDLAVFAEESAEVLSGVNTVKFGPGLNTKQAPSSTGHISKPTNTDIDKSKENEEEDIEEQESEDDDDDSNDEVEDVSSEETTIPQKAIFPSRKRPLVKDDDLPQASTKKHKDSNVAEENITRQPKKEEEKISASDELLSSTTVTNIPSSDIKDHGKENIIRPTTPDTTEKSTPAHTAPPSEQLDKAVPGKKHRGTNGEKRKQRLTSAERRKKKRRRQSGERRLWRSKEFQDVQRISSKNSLDTHKTHKSSRRSSVVGRRSSMARRLASPGGLSSGFETWYITRGCCKAGKEEGRHVIGHSRDIESQCQAGAAKAVEEIPMDWGLNVHRMCWESFVSCCHSRAVRGLEMTSTEFKTHFPEMTEPTKTTPTDVHDLPPIDENWNDDAEDVLDRRGDVRYRSMTEKTRDNDEEEEFEEDEYNGPARFDDIDNDMAEFDADLMRGPLVRKSQQEQKSDNDNKIDVDEDEDFDDDEDEDEAFERDFGLLMFNEDGLKSEVPEIRVDAERRPLHTGRPNRQQPEQPDDRNVLHGRIGNILEGEEFEKEVVKSETKFQGLGDKARDNMKPKILTEEKDSAKRDGSGIDEINLKAHRASVAEYPESNRNPTTDAPSIAPSTKHRKPSRRSSRRRSSRRGERSKSRRRSRGRSREARRGGRSSRRNRRRGRQNRERHHIARTQNQMKHSRIPMDSVEMAAAYRRPFLALDSKEQRDAFSRKHFRLRKRGEKSRILL